MAKWVFLGTVCLFIAIFALTSQKKSTPLPVTPPPPTTKTEPPKPQGEAPMKASEDRSSFGSIAFQLVNDALDLIPDELEKNIVKGDDLDPIMRGAGNYDQGDVSESFILTPENLGEQVSFVIVQFYGENPSDVNVPGSVYFDGYSDIQNFSKAITAAKDQISKSNNIDRDRYNSALNILTNLWLKDLKKAGLAMKDLPKEGVYLRDSAGKLYPYRG